jgi:hypothetical protein
MLNRIGRRTFVNFIVTPLSKSDGGQPGVVNIP